MFNQWKNNRTMTYFYRYRINVFVHLFKMRCAYNNVFCPELQLPEIVKKQKTKQKKLEIP